MKQLLEALATAVPALVPLNVEKSILSESIDLGSQSSLLTTIQQITQNVTTETGDVYGEILKIWDYLATHAGIAVTPEVVTSADVRVLNRTHYHIGAYSAYAPDLEGSGQTTWYDEYNEYPPASAVGLTLQHQHNSNAKWEYSILNPQTGVEAAGAITSTPLEFFFTFQPEVGLDPTSLYTYSGRIDALVSVVAEHYGTRILRSHVPMSVNGVLTQDAGRLVARDPFSIALDSSRVFPYAVGDVTDPRAHTYDAVRRMLLLTPGYTWHPGSIGNWLYSFDVNNITDTGGSHAGEWNLAGTTTFSFSNLSVNRLNLTEVLT